MQRYNEDRQPDKLDDVNCWVLLKALLPEVEVYERVYEA